MSTADQMNVGSRVYKGVANTPIEDSRWLTLVAYEEHSKEASDPNSTTRPDPDGQACLTQDNYLPLKPTTSTFNNTPYK